MRSLAAAPLLLAAALSAQQPAPEIAPSGIVSAADNSGAEAGLAPGSLFTIYGRNLATGGEARVRVRPSGGEAADAPLLYVSSSQINARMPDGVPPGTAEISVQTAAGESAARTVTIVEARFTAFTTSGRPFGPAVIQQYRPSGITLNRLLDPARSGDALVIWGTGLGGRLHEDVTVHIGMFEVHPFYAGPAPGLPGVDQINLFLPEGPQERCFLPFLVRAGAIASPVYSLSTGAGGPCAPEVAIAPSALEALDSGGTVQVTALSVGETAEAWVGVYDAAFLSLLVSYDVQPAAAPVACSRRTYSFNRTTGPPAARLPAELYGLSRSTAALAVTVTGPGNCAWTFTRSEDGVYRAAAPAGCPAAAYSIGNPGTIPYATGNIPLGNPLPPVPEVAFDRSVNTVSWRETTGARLTLDLSSSFVLPGSIFNGQTDVRELSCRLSGYQGAGEVSASDVAWALGLPSIQSVSARLSLTGLQGGSWSGPSHALLVRTTQTLRVPVELR